MLSQNRVCVFIPRVGGHIFCREFKGLKDGEEVSVERVVGTRRVVVRARREGKKLRFEVYDRAPRHTLRLGEATVKVVQTFVDSLDVKLMEEEKGVWRIMLPRWYKDIPVDVHVEEGRGFALLRVSGSGGQLDLRGCFLVVPEGRRIKVFRASICRKCLRPMVEKELLKELPQVEGVGVAYDAIGCIACKLEGDDEARVS